MNKTVFISSTYADLKEYRRAIWDLLRAFDVNVRGMEEFGARTETPLATCLAEVELSDIYIGVVAFRLGSVDEETGKSFTQVEYEVAYQRHKEILIYLADEENSQFQIKYIDRDENREKLEAFKRLLRERHTVDTFISVDDLKEKLGRDLKRLLTQKVAAAATSADEYVASKQVIDRFLLVPKEYSGREVRVVVQFNGKPYPASKSICAAFNLEFGKIIGRKIKILKPEGYEKSELEELYAASKHIDTILNGSDRSEHDVYVKLQFAEKKVSKTRANYKDETYYEEPHYPGEPELIHYSADAKVILLLTKAIEPDRPISENPDAQQDKNA